VNDQSETTGNLGDYIPAWAKRDHLIFVGSKEKKKTTTKRVLNPGCNPKI